MVEKDVIIIGSGPAGLRAGLEAKNAGLDYLILEKGDVAQSWRDIKQDMVLLSPCLPQRDWTSISEQFPIWKMDVHRPFCFAHEFLDYLIRFFEHFNLQIKTNCDVQSISKKDNRFEVTTNHSGFKAKYLIVASGIFSNPFIPDIPGLRNNPIVSHSHQFKSIDSFRNQRVVIIGSGNSAAEIAIALAGYAQVYLLTRHKLKFFSKTRNLCNIRGLSESLLLELIDMEIIRHISNSKIIKVDGNTIQLENKIFDVQSIICATGYNADLSALGITELGIDERTKFPYINDHGESTSINNLFFAGPLAFTRISSLLIHGFIRMIPGTVHQLAQKLTSTTTV